MAEKKQPADKRNWWDRLWGQGGFRLLGIPIGIFLVFLAGSITVIGSDVAIHATGSEEFCTSACHSMEAFTAPEWRDSPHYKNASGVRATCSDCHIPQVYPQKLIVKTRSGITDMYHEMKGTIATREKYEAHRARMAEEVWAYMTATDSRECRTCHSEEHFVLEDQGEEAAQAHVTGPLEGKTCIDCHKGIAHKTPDEIAEEQQGIAREAADETGGEQPSMPQVSPETILRGQPGAADETAEETTGEQPGTAAP
jgi:nitrate/TMAO reductase-like tetraheme cytochrome c subunit